MQCKPVCTSCQHFSESTEQLTVQPKSTTSKVVKATKPLPFVIEVTTTPEAIDLPLQNDVTLLIEETPAVAKNPPGIVVMDKTNTPSDEGEL